MKAILEGEIVGTSKPGPQSKYSPEMCQIIIDIGKRGDHITSMRAALGGISKQTWYDWQEKYPEFKDAVEQARLFSQEWWEQAGKNGTVGLLKGFKPNSYAYIMGNKFPDEYKQAGNTTEVTVHNNTLNLTSDQITQKIAQKLEKFKSLGIVIDGIEAESDE